MLSAGARWVLSRLASAATPKPKLSLADWAEANIILSEDSNTSRPGPLSLAQTSYLRAPLTRLDPSDPARWVNVLGSAQSGKSLIGQIKCAHTMAENPGPIGVYLPSLDDARKYSEEKMQALIDASPALRHRVRKVSSRSNDGSNTLRKRFVGGSLRIATASSPNALQLVSFRDLVLEEVAGYEADVGSRGSPIAQARKRQGAWETGGAKTLMVSAAGTQGSCPSTKAHEDGTAHEIYLPCPHCAGFNRWEWEDMNAPVGAIGAHFACRLCGGVVEHKHKAAMVANHVFVATYKDSDAENPAPPSAFEPGELQRWQGRTEKDRQPSFRWWLYVSPFTTWDLLWSEGQEAKASGLAAEKTFWQQTLARAWDEGRDAPDHVKLHQLREPYAEAEVPHGVYLLTGGVDVQGDRLHWAVYGWAPGAEWWLIERGIIAGDPAGAEVWAELAKILQRRYPHDEGGDLGVEAFGVDSGYKTNQVYAFCGKHPTARAMDGRPGWSLPLIGKPKRVKAKLDGRIVGATMLYPTGTWSLKTELQYSLRQVIELPPGMRKGGRGHFHAGVDENYLRELVSEVVEEEQNRGRISRVWKVRQGFRNEEMDIWCMARALAYGLGVGVPKKEFDWEAARQKIVGAGDLFSPKRISANESSDDAEPGAANAPPLPAKEQGWQPKYKFGAPRT